LETVDVAIIGGGVAGLSCALYTGKAGMKTLVLDKDTSQLRKVKTLLNFPGISEGISGEQWLHTAQQQARNFGVELVRSEVASVRLSDSLHTLITGDGLIWGASYLVFAVNLGYELLEKTGFDLEVNEHVPSRKIRSLTNVDFDGKTTYDRVYMAGLSTGIPSQTVIAAGQGAFVGIQIASEFLGKPYMWHD
jgi:thioredoxin reductase (NADPH)